MKVKKLLRGLLSLALCASVVNVFGGATVTVHAEEEEEEQGIVAKKEAKVNEEDGSYTIFLDAYVKGEIVTVMTPVDVILVVDVSNSMAWSTQNSGNTDEWSRMPSWGQTSKIEDAMAASETFANILLSENPDKEADERNTLTFVTFAGQDGNDPQWIDSTQTVFDSVTSESAADNYFRQVDITRASGNSQYVLHLPTGTGDNKGGTNYDYAFGEANNAINTVQGKYDDYSETGRKTFVVFMTDGAPSVYNERAYQRNEGPTVWLNYISNNANTNARTVYNRVDGNMFAVGFDLDHGGFSNVSYTQEQLKPVLENMAGSGTHIDVELVTDADSLKEIFASLARKAAEAAVNLGSQSVMKDIVADSFKLPDGATSDNISVSVVPWDTTTHNWSTTVSYSKDEWASRTNPTETITPVVNEETATVDITGFDYSKHCKVTCTDAEDPEVNAQAAKIVVSFTIFAKPESITGSSVVTNGSESGIYDDEGNPVVTFDIPNVTFDNATYVIDYAKPITLDYSKILKTVTRIDDPGDNILNGKRVEPAGASSTDSFDFTDTYETNYAHVKYENVYDGPTQQTTQFTVTYEPKTTNWNGYDNLFVMGKPINADSSIEGGNVWGLLTVVPANNVYYEDTFITAEGNNGENSDTVGITYTGAWEEDGTVPTPPGQIENANGQVMGWELTLSDDTEYSDGSAHYLDRNEGTGSVSFSFTGTGVDVYSRTNNSTGTIMVQLSGTPEGSDTVVKKNYVISNKAADGNYYQIPTFTVDNLDYGTYNVKITVTNADKKRLMYYLDGIRVYNPIKPKETEDLVIEAYKEELGAVFKEVKDLLKNGQIAFIDEDADGEPREVDYETTGFDPEHEVYVKAGSRVVLVIKQEDLGKNFYIGIKAPKGETSIAMTYGDDDPVTEEIGHSTDLYYRVIPNSNGEIVIENTGSNLLSLTKIRVTNPGNTGADPNTDAFDAVEPGRALAAVERFVALNRVEAETDVLTPEEAEIVEPTEPEEVVEVPEETEPEIEITELGEEDIEISVTEPEPVVEEKPAAENKPTSLLKRFYQTLFSAVSRLFRW